MSDSEPNNRTLSQVAVLVALLISVGSVVWNAAVVSNSVGVNRENIARLDGRMTIGEAKIDVLNTRYAEINAKLDFLIQQRAQK